MRVYSAAEKRRTRFLSLLVLLISLIVTVALGFMVRTGRLKIGQAGCVGAECPQLVTTTSPGPFQIIYTIKNESDQNASFNLEVDSNRVSSIQAITPQQTKKYQYNVSYAPGTQIVLKVTSGSLTIVGFEVVDQTSTKVLLTDPDVNSALVATDVNNFFSLIYSSDSSVPLESPRSRESLDTSTNTFVSTESIASDVTIQATATETIRVLELRYFPREADSRRLTMNTHTADFKSALTNASKPKGYKNAAVAPSVNVQIVKTIERLENSPRTTGPYESWYHSLDSILTSNNNEICNEIVNNKIDQVWAWFDVNYDTGGYNKEYQWVYSNELNEYQYQSGNVYGADNLCGGKRTFAFLGLDQNLPSYYALHSFAHAAEDILGKLVLPKLFWTPFTGNTDWDRHPAPVCGNVHYPPNGTTGEGGIGYDYENTTNVTTSCENWKPDGTGTRTTFNCTRWGCTQVGYLTWWGQNWPNKANGLTYEGKPVPNWWQFFYNIDANIAQMVASNQYLDTKITSKYFKAPTTSSPQNGLQLTEAAPTFYWYDTKGATGYTVQVSTTAAFSTFLLNVTSTTPALQYASLVEFPKNTTLYWRVRGNAGTTSTAWSPTISFTSASASNKPTLTAPATNTILPETANLKPTLKWQTAYSATIPAPQKFDIQIATDNIFSEDAVKVNLSNQTVSDDIGGTAILQKKVLNTTTTLSKGTTYYWRVRARAANGHASGWSPIFSFRTPIGTVSTLSQPTNNSTINTSRPTFQWEGIDNVTSYTVMYTTVQPVTATTVFTALGTVPGTTTQFTPTADLLRNKTYTWKVKATNTLYGTSLSSASVFTSANQSNIPTLTKPLTNSLTTGVDPLKPTLEWKTIYSATIPKPVSYDIQVTKKEDTTFNNPVINKSSVPGTQATGTTTTLEVRSWPVDVSLQNLTQYIWRVRAKNSLGQTSGWSTVFTFKTPIAQVATLSTPASNSTATIISPTFDWSDVPGATSYTVEAQIAPSTVWTVLGTSTTSTWTPAAAGLARNKLYTWRVKATNTAFVSTSISGPRAFTSANPPATPVLSLPAASAIVATPTANLTWTQPLTAGYAQATRYHVQIATDTAFTSIVTQNSSVTGTTFQTPQLSPGTTYYWRVKGFSSSSHETPWTAARIFKTAPGVISLATVTSQQSDSRALSFAHTFSGTGRYLVVAASYHTADVSGKVSSLTYAGAGMTLVKRSLYHEYATEIWVLSQTATLNNTNTLAINFSGPTDSHIVRAMTFTNVMAGTPLRLASGNENGEVPPETSWSNRAVHSLPVTSATTDLVVGVHTSFAGGFTNDASIATGASLVRNDRFTNVISTIYTRVPTTTTTTFPFSVVNNYPWSSVGISLRSR